ncbi:uncharacterized protein PG986_008835 [Apiospora aurea]|uniref:Uncharacterized protein n=1 Tax=Apiospora aurea TaxID=335848 RepID=A0ABR1Q602_9PEZI
MADNLLFALALCYIHELDYAATERLCKTLWETCDNHNPFKDDILRLLLVAYRLSGQPILAEAIQEGNPGILDSPQLTPSDFIVQKEELLCGLFRTDIIKDTQQPVIEFLRHRIAFAETTRLQRLLISESFSDSSSTLVNVDSDGEIFRQKASTAKPKVQVFERIKNIGFLSSSHALANTLEAEPRTSTAACTFDSGSRYRTPSSSTASGKRISPSWPWDIFKGRWKSWRRPKVGAYGERSRADGWPKLCRWPSNYESPKASSSRLLHYDLHSLKYCYELQGSFFGHEMEVPPRGYELDSIETSIRHPSGGSDRQTMMDIPPEAQAVRLANAYAASTWSELGALALGFSTALGSSLFNTENNYKWLVYPKTAPS